jgi:hypothetical protein
VKIGSPRSCPNRSNHALAFTGGDTAVDLSTSQIVVSKRLQRPMTMLEFLLHDDHSIRNSAVRRVAGFTAVAKAGKPGLGLIVFPDGFSEKGLL